MPTYCRKCGTQLKDGAQFCGNCGAKIQDVFYQDNSSSDESNHLFKVQVPLKENFYEQPKAWAIIISSILVIAVIITLFSVYQNKHKHDNDIINYVFYYFEENDYSPKVGFITEQFISDSNIYDALQSNGYLSDEILQVDSKADNESVIIAFLSYIQLANLPWSNYFDSDADHAFNENDIEIALNNISKNASREIVASDYREHVAATGEQVFGVYNSASCNESSLEIINDYLGTKYQWTNASITAYGGDAIDSIDGDYIWI